MHRSTLCFLGLTVLVATGIAGCLSQSKRQISERAVTDEASDATTLSDLKLEQYQDLASEFPEEPKYQERIARIFWYQDDYKNALVHLDKARALDPENPKYDWMQARIYYAIGSHQNAERCYRNLIDKTEDKYTGPDFELGCLYLFEGRNDLAEKQFQRCLEIDPAFPGAHYGLGQVALGRKDRDKAVQYFETYLKIGGTEHFEEVMRLLRGLQPELERTRIRRG